MNNIVDGYYNQKSYIYRDIDLRVNVYMIDFLLKAYSNVPLIQYLQTMENERKQNTSIPAEVKENKSLM